MSCSVRIAKIHKAAVSALQDTLKNLYNIHVKLQCANKPFRSNQELPMTVVANVSDVCSMVCDRLTCIFGTKDDEHYKSLHDLGEELVQASCGDKILDILREIYRESWAAVEEWNAQDCLFIGVIPKEGNGDYFQCEYGAVSGKVYITWDKEKFGDNFCAAVSQMLQLVREERRQPTPSEYIVQHLAYLDLCQGKWGNNETARSLGTPGFRPHTQTYMSLTDPGEGHVMGTTRFTEWMDGAIVHVEHLERPRHLPREKIESYRVPSMLDFSRVRLHVGSTAPTTYFLGRAVKDSGNFEEDFLKIIHITAAAASYSFFMGAAECKISMEGLSTSQAVRYMKALRVQIQRSRKQVLSAAWNLNQVLNDDFDTECCLEDRMTIAVRAIDITSIGGFDKVTWDGASDTYPSKCIMYQLTFEEALTIVHEAHVKGLITYFSAGFKFNEIQHAVYAGVDGIGIGGAQVLRYMDSDTGMHGPYTEENIPKILNHRDMAAYSLRGRGVNLLVRLDTMYFEGSISQDLDCLRQKLFKALFQVHEHEINESISQLKDVENFPREENTPYLYRAKRIIEADNPLLKEFCTPEEWENFTRILRCQVMAKDEKSLMEEYDSDPWISIRQRYRKEQSKTSYVRMTSFDISYKC